MCSLTAASLLFLSSVLAIPAQEKKDLPPKHLRFLALGSNFVWDEEITPEGIRQGGEPPKGTLPPSSLNFNAGGPLQPLRLQLGSKSDSFLIPGDQASFRLMEGELENPRLWLEKKAPAASFNLGILYRKLNGGDWTAPQLKMLPDDAGSFPAGTIRFVNLSDRPVYFQVKKRGAKKRGIAPGKVYVFETKGRALTLDVGFVWNVKTGDTTSLFNNRLPMAPGTRHQFVFYQDDLKNARQRVALNQYPEDLPAK